MEVFETNPKPWGNSLGITIPRDIIKKEKISPNKRLRIFVLSLDKSKLKEAFGSLKLKKPTQEAMDEIDKGYD